MLQIQIQNQVFEVSGLINVTPVNPPPAAPSNLDIADASAPGSVNLLWDNHAAPPYSTEIWRSDNGAAYVLIDTVPAGATTYSDATYPNTPGGYSEYQVRAVNGPLNSTFSNVRGVATTLGDLGLTIYNFPTIRVHFGDVLLGIVAKVFLLPTLREIRGGGFISSAPLSGLDLSQLVFVDSGFTLGNSDLFSITLAALQTVNVGDVRFADNANLVDLSLPLLSFVIGDFINTGCPALTTAAFPGLDTVNGSVDFSGDAQLQQLDLSLLGIIGGACFLNDLTALATLQLANLQTVGADLRLNNSTSLGALVLGSLGSVGGSLLVSNCAAATMDFSSLQTVNVVLDVSQATSVLTISFPNLSGGVQDALFGGPSVQSFDAPLLSAINPGALTFNGSGNIQTVSLASLDNTSTDINAQGCPALVTLALPSLTICNGTFNCGSCPSLTTLTVPNLQIVGGDFIGSGNTVLTTLSLPALQTLAGGLTWNACPGLSTVQLPNWTVSDNTTITFDADAVAVGNAATGEGIDGILRRGTLSGVGACDFELANGTNASPTGGITNADYLTLVANGNTVNIN